MTDPTPATGYELDPPLPDPWERKEIIYTRYTVNEDEGLRGDPRSYVIEGTDIDAFVKARAGNEPLPTWTHILEKNPKDPTTVRPIDIYVRRPCYVVIELDRNLSWQFAERKPGIVQKSNAGSMDNDLHHVLSDGQIVGPDKPGKAGCRILFFSVRTRGGGRDFEYVGFVCNIENYPKMPFEDPLVDPDIPNNGGKFPFVDEWG